MVANFVLDALKGLLSSKSLPVSVGKDVEEISKKQLASVQGAVVSSNFDETTVIFDDGSAVTRHGKEVFIVDGKVAAKHPLVVKTSALKAFVK